MPALSYAAQLWGGCVREKVPACLTVAGIGQVSGWSSTISGPMTVKKTHDLR